jgi:hypothetical protein
MELGCAILMETITILKLRTWTIIYHSSCNLTGKYNDEIRETIMALVTQFGVSLNKVNGVIQTVVQKITGKTLSRLPSAGVKIALYF